MFLLSHYTKYGAIYIKGETLAEAAIRETMEETGIPCEFVSLICFRHMTGYRYGCDDIYFVCHLRPLSNNIKIDTNELSACKWIPVSRINKTTHLCLQILLLCYQQIDEYVNSPTVRTNRLIVECYLQQKTNGVKINTDSIPHYFDGYKDMSFYSLSSHQATEQKIPKL